MFKDGLLVHSADVGMIHQNRTSMTEGARIPHILVSGTEAPAIRPQLEIVQPHTNVCSTAWPPCYVKKPTKCVATLILNTTGNVLIT